MFTPRVLGPNDCPYCFGLGHGERTGSICHPCGGSGLQSLVDPMCLDMTDLHEEHGRAVLRRLEREAAELDEQWTAWLERAERRERFILALVLAAGLVWAAVLALVLVRQIHR